MDGLGSLAVAATDVVVGCLMMWGDGSREANNMGQELLNSGVHAQAAWQDVAQPLEARQLSHPHSMHQCHNVI